METTHTEAVFIERCGRPASVLVSPERYEVWLEGLEGLEGLEDADDAQAFGAAMAEEGPNIPWDEGKADLGRT